MQKFEGKPAGEALQLNGPIGAAQAILDYSPTVIYIKDLEGRYMLVNRRFEELFHMKREDIVGKLPYDIFGQEIAGALRNNDHKVLAARAPLEFEEVLSHNGRMHTYMSVKFPLFNVTGQIYALCGISTDITEKKHLTEQLIQAAKLESVGTLAAGVAHEVKNPLQTILMGLDYLDRNLTHPGETLAQTLRDMREAVRRANTIIQELVQLSTPADFQMQPEDLNALVEHILLLINNSIISAQVSEVRHFGNLPRVLMDKGKMEQVFINLFMNALQAMPPGGVLTVTTRAGRLGRDFELSARNFPQFQRGDRLVMVEVLDSGPGIPEAYMPKLFEPFFTTKPAGVGTGLGLPVVKKIMELHSGAIDIHNAPHGGVLVTLILRAVKEDYDDT